VSIDLNETESLHAQSERITGIENGPTMSDWYIQTTGDGKLELIIDICDLNEPYNRICEELERERHVNDDIPGEHETKDKISGILSSAASMGSEIVRSIV
jgi:hypothetical protein